MKTKATTPSNSWSLPSEKHLIQAHPTALKQREDTHKTHTSWDPDHSRYLGSGLKCNMCSHIHLNSRHTSIYKNYKWHRCKWEYAKKNFAAANSHKNKWKKKKRRSFIPRATEREVSGLNEKLETSLIPLLNSQDCTGNNEYFLLCNDSISLFSWISR